MAFRCNYKTHFGNVCAFCCKNVSLLIRMVWRYFLSISLAAAGILLIRNVSGNQIMLAVSVTAGTLKRKR